MKDLVTVIVTCYNHEQYIEECLLSIFQQTYANIELIVINDGSTDRSDERITATLTASPYKNSRYIAQKNQGVCATRNLGLELATGEFLLFVDADNYLDAPHIEALRNTALDTAADIVYTDLYDPDSQKLFMKAKPFDFKAMLEHNYIDNCSLLRRSAIDDVRYDLSLNRKFLEDYDFLLCLIIRKKAKPLYAEGLKINYRVLENSISRKENHTTREYFYSVYLYILQKYAAECPEEIFQALKSHLMTLEDRLADLTDHLDDVTAYVKTLEEKAEYLKVLEEIISNQQQEKQAILNSVSYRLGNKIVRVYRGVILVAKNPRLLKKAMERIKSAAAIRLQKIPSAKKIFLKQLRKRQRSRNNYQNPKRVLVYVIYENEEKIQTYKILFLKALAELSQRVLIVVNGELPKESVSELEKYGQVVLRENKGYDTGAFRDGILLLGKSGLTEYDELLLVNDTNIGPMSSLAPVFEKMYQRNLDFWGISYGEEQPDITGYNKYHYIPLHLQSYFLVIGRSLMNSPHFYDYWEKLTDTDSREKAIGRHETTFTKHFEDLGYTHGAVTENNEDSAMYIHPLKMLQSGVPLVKYAALNNYNDEKFLWQGLVRKSEVPELLSYIEEKSDYPIEAMNDIMEKVTVDKKSYILIIDGVENAIPQCTRYRVLNKAEQLRSFGYTVKTVNMSAFRLSDAEWASMVIIYRCGYSDLLAELCSLAKRFNKRVLYDIDDLVIDTKFTDQLEYTQKLAKIEKENYDASVRNYGKMMQLCEGVVTSTNELQELLKEYHKCVLLNRNLVSEELVSISNQHCKDYALLDERVKIGYFSGSITHNANFELIKPALLRLLDHYSTVELHLVGHLHIPSDLKPYQDRIVVHPYVDWHELPGLISEVDINLAPLTQSVFNSAKSEIKWLEAALVKVPTAASAIGSFSDMLTDGLTGVLANDNEWYEKLEQLVASKKLRQEIAENAHRFVLTNCTTNHKEDQLTEFVQNSVAEITGN